MYERMLDKNIIPTVAEMTKYCAENAERFSAINEWLTSIFSTEQKVVFPYGNNYGWGIGHYKKKKLICNIFAEAGAFTVMMRLTNKQYEVIYDSMNKTTQEQIDKKYLCGDGGWIHYRVVCEEHYDDLRKLLETKCA